MLKKLLKYDLRAVFRLWWVMAISSLGLAVIGGICLHTLIGVGVDERSTIITIVAALGMLATVIGLSAFLVVTVILIYVRFYKNFFTDEGYLTFTLPVKRSQLLNSKLITTFIATAATGGTMGDCFYFFKSLFYFIELFFAVKSFFNVCNRYLFTITNDFVFHKISP